MKKLGKYSLGIGDRFGHQGHAQLEAIMEAERKGIEITPVWNKSYREHKITGTEPSDVRKEADSVIKKAGFRRPYFVDADHIKLDTVDKFIESSDYFTIDVASYIGKKAGIDEIKAFLQSAGKYAGKLKIPGIRKTFEINTSQISAIAGRYLFAAIKAWEVFRKIEKRKGKENFLTEISMDEVSDPQTPIELFFILRMLGDENIPVQTIAPRFSGKFRKGVDYEGDAANFENEFETNLLVIDYAIHEFGLPGDLKMSIHSGSDKFRIYPAIGALARKYEKGFHLKSAGTTWLEEVIGLAEAGNDALDYMKELYCQSLERIEELCSPYSDLIDINVSKLPGADVVAAWNGRRFAESLRHVPGNINYNPNMRQLFHVSYKLAAERKEDFYKLLDLHQKAISHGIFENLYKRHICRIFDID